MVIQFANPFDPPVGIVFLTIGGLIEWSAGIEGQLPIPASGPHTLMLLGAGFC